MRMLFLAASAAALSFSASAPAKTAEAKSFTYEGTTYTYTVVNKGEAQVIKGKTSPITENFSLTLADGKVSGYFGGSSVYFKAEDAKGATNKGGADIIALLTR